MLTRNRNFNIAIILLTGLLFVSCSLYKKPALGRDNVIVVLADQRIYDTHKPDLEKIFTDPIYTPMQENRFNLQNITLDEFKKGSNRYKNIILLTNVDSETAEAQYIKKMLSDKVIEGVRNGDYYYAMKENVWSKDQTVLILMDSKNVHLGGYLERFSTKLFGFFNDKMEKNIKKRLFDTYNNKKAQKYAKENYNFDIFVPHDFEIGEQGKEKDKFIRFRRLNPDRWLTVFRTDYNSGASFQDNIIEARNRIGKQFADSVKINTEIISFQPDSTFAPDGLKVKGIWEYSDGGGPFFTYAYIRSGSFYLIDGAVFAPSKDKYPYIIQLDLMAKTVKFPETEK